MMTTTQDRWKAAIKEIRAGGVKFRQNVQQCCRGCITKEQLGLASDDDPYGFTYGGQGNAYAWDEGEMVTRTSLTRARGSGWWRDLNLQPYGVVFVNHGGEPENHAAKVIADAFRNNGFRVVWDGERHSCVEIHMIETPGRLT